MITELPVSFMASLAVVASALMIDLTVGEPPERIHLTVWMGRLISWLFSRVPSDGGIEKLWGVILGASTIAIFTVPVWILLNYLELQTNIVICVASSAVLLKPTIALKSLGRHVIPIAVSIREKNLEEARRLTQRIVGRNTKPLDLQHLISATVESIAEASVDGVTSPLFYFSLFGVPGAVAYRTVNTLDSMVGYQTPRYINVGRFSAKLDALVNYVPARLTGMLMIIACWLCDENWKSAFKTLKKDRTKTGSLNRGWTLAVMAGALDVQLEKIGSYALGFPKMPLSTEHIRRALRVVRATIFLFVFFVVIPLIFLVTLIV